MILDEVRARLLAAQDVQYQAFHQRLIPNVDSRRVIGVRTPCLRSIAKEYARDVRIDEFLNALPHYYYEENNLHAFILSQDRDYDRTMQRLHQFLPYVDNWATCDQMRPAAFSHHTDCLRHEITGWMASDHVYTIRFGIEMLMNFYLDDRFEAQDLTRVAAVSHDDYYVKMMVAWYFATALAKQWEQTIPYLKEHRLEEWTHRKTVSKAIESYRITAEQKDFLRTLRT